MSDRSKTHRATQSFIFGDLLVGLQAPFPWPGQIVAVLEVDVRNEEMGFALQFILHLTTTFGEEAWPDRIVSVIQDLALCRTWPLLALADLPIGEHPVGHGQYIIPLPIR